MFDRQKSAAVVISGVAALLISAGCGPAGEDPEAVDVPDLTNVDPRDAATSPDEPDLEDAQAENVDIDNEIDPREPRETSISQPEEDIFADARIEAVGDSGVSGSLRFHQAGEMMRITGSLQGLEPGKHGLHIHAVGDCSAADASSAGGHFAPDDDRHGSPQDIMGRHHVGDLGNIVADENGVASIDKRDPEMTLATGDNTIIDRAVIVHAEPDDLISQPAGDAGARIGCGVVELDVSPAYTGS